MAGSFVIMLREGFEAALIVGIILAVLARTGRAAYNRLVFAGVAAAVVASLGFALLADGVSGLFEGAGQEVLNGIVLALAAVMITYVVVWLSQARKQMGQKLAAQVKSRANAQGIGVFLLVFLTVFREGAESVLFLWGAMLSGAGADLATTLTGGLLGLATAVAVAWAIFAGGRQVPLGAFFSATTALLVLLAAGMLSSAVGFWVAVDWLPALSYSVWNTAHILPESHGLGAFLGLMFGYNANPTLMEVCVYTAYLVGIGSWLVFGRMRRQVSAQAVG